MRKAYLTALAVAFASVSHASFTLATFADPTTVADSVMFTWDMNAGTLSGEWTASGLTMQTPGFNGPGTLTDVHYVMAPVAVTPTGNGTFYTMGAGLVEFYTTDPNDVFMTIQFSGGSFLSPFNIGASQMVGPSVSFSGPSVPGNLTDETFSFALTNAKQVGNFVTYTTSFTSSASIVPEPVTLFVVAPAIFALLARRKRA